MNMNDSQNEWHERPWNEVNDHTSCGAIYAHCGWLSHILSPSQVRKYGWLVRAAFYTAQNSTSFETSFPPATNSIQKRQNNNVLLVFSCLYLNLPVHYLRQWIFRHDSKLFSNANWPLDCIVHCARAQFPHRLIHFNGICPQQRVDSFNPLIPQRKCYLCKLLPIKINRICCIFGSNLYKWFHQISHKFIPTNSTMVQNVCIK